jgi:hypothetical protein
LHSLQKTAWLEVAEIYEDELSAESLVVSDISVGTPMIEDACNTSLEKRAGGLRITRKRYTGNTSHVITDVDVLFDVDAIDLRPHWTLMQTPLQLEAPSELPVAKLSARHGTQSRADRPPLPLRARADGTFRILQISDTHTVTGPGTCKDAIDADGCFLPASEADPRTVAFLGEVLDIEKPDLVLLTGDQVHHDILDTQSALFKVVAPLIERKIPYAAVFGNHDSEGAYALSRKHTPFLTSALLN